METDQPTAPIPRQPYRKDTTLVAAACPEWPVSCASWSGPRTTTTTDYFVSSPFKNSLMSWSPQRLWINLTRFVLVGKRGLYSCIYTLLEKLTVVLWLLSSYTTVGLCGESLVVIFCGISQCWYAVSVWLRLKHEHTFEKWVGNGYPNTTEPWLCNSYPRYSKILMKPF